mgnify:CR=1 FL=1
MRRLKFVYMLFDSRTEDEPKYLNAHLNVKY